jgi:hypothetical protein
VFLQATHNRPNMLQVCAPRIAENQDTVEEDENEYPDEVPQDIVHESMESRRIGEAEQHHKKLEVAMMRPECCLLHIGQLHENLMVPDVEVELGEEAGTTQFIKQFINHRDWKHVMDSLGVEHAVIHAKLP